MEAHNPASVPARTTLPNEKSQEEKTRVSTTTAIWTASVTVAMVALLPWARRWFYSGAAIETLLVIYGDSINSRIFADFHLWTLLATFNLVYAICSTSWLLYGFFTALCFPLIFITCLCQFEKAADRARRLLRKTLRQLHFTKDKIALFTIPALEIDTDVDGLLVVRGIVISLTNLTIVAHGIELGLKLADDIELSMYADKVTISLFRRIEIGDVYANVKGGKVEMTFAGVEEVADDDSSEFSVLIEDTPLLRAATAGSAGFKDRPKLRESLTGVSFMKDSSASDGLEYMTTLSPDDDAAEKQFHARLAEIQTTSAVYQSRQQVKLHSRGENGFTLENDQDMRAAICAELHTVPSIVHPPERSVRVTTLRNLSKPSVRRFMHRLPLLLRLLLGPLSYFHPITISSINAAGSGRWLSEMLQTKVFKQYTENSFELRKLERRIIAWLTKANFCVQLADIKAMAQVPISTAFDITAMMKFNDIMAYRTVPDSGVMSQVLRLGGAHATASIPSFLLPHHEHIVPPKPTVEDEENLKAEAEEADGLPKTVQKESELKKVQKDETTITMSAHASLPAALDQSLLNFVAALVKATKIIEVEKEIADDQADTSSTTNNTSHSRSQSTPIGITNPDDPTNPLSRSSTIDSGIDPDLSSEAAATASIPDSPSKVSLRAVARGIRATLKDGARDWKHSTVDGIKSVRTAVVGGMVNDRWIAKLVGKVAVALQKAQGDVGYSGAIPVPLAMYRGEEGLESKLLP